LTAESLSGKPTFAHAVAIIGLGPKGLYCLERLLAQFKAHPLGNPLHIHVFNRSANFGASPIYDPALPDYILVNLSVGEIDLWSVQEPPSAAERGANFLAWHQQKFQRCKPLTGEEYLSRAVVGRYLIEGFHFITSHLPEGVTLSCHVGEVLDIRPQEQRYFLDFVDKSGHKLQILADKVLLATGHSRIMPDEDEKCYQAFATRHAGAAFIPFVYPVVENMAPIPAGARVAMKGVGLTFIDAVLELTEGRGGQFQRTPDGALSYRASGREPSSIIPFSRTGLPMTPKAYDLPQVDRPLTFFNHNALAVLTSQTPDGKLDLENDLLPLIELEMEYQYCLVEMKDSGERIRLGQCAGHPAQARDVIDSYLRSRPGKEHFDFRALLNPVGEHEVKTGAEFAAFVEQYMEQEIAHARRGLAGSGFKAAAHIWYEVRKTLGSILQFGGLKPESQRKLMEYYYPRLKRIAFGPPIVNIEKLLALQRAGILDFSAARNPAIRPDEATGCFELRCDKNNATVHVEVLVDATYPAVNLPRDATPLYRNLQKRGLVRAYQNQSSNGDGSAYSPGSIDMTRGPQFVVNGEGVCNPDIAVIGIPTEGNLVGNLTVTQDHYPSLWAAEIIRQLALREQSWASRSAHLTAIG
jgi:FAD-NAD(P)-binding